MTTHTMSAPAAGFSLKKLMIRMLVLAFVGATMFYAKTIGLLAKGAWKGFKASNKMEE